MSEIKLLDLRVGFELESGDSLPELTLAYHTLGSLNAERSNVVFVSHALTGNTRSQEWWAGLIGPDKPIDPEKHFIITPNAIGSCYGSTGPDSIDPRTGKPFGKHFPVITPRDIAKADLLLLDALGIIEIHLGIGGSMGGMVLLEMASERPTLFKHLIPVAVSGAHSAWRVAFSSLIRKTIKAFGEDDASLKKGLRLARQIGMTSYRSSTEFESRFARERLSGDPGAYYEQDNLFEVESYLEHQGDKLVGRFTPHAYLTLTRAMELYDLQRGRPDDNPPANIRSKTLCIAVSSDILYPVEEIRAFSQQFPHGECAVLDSSFGHDSFLVDGDGISAIVAKFLEPSNVREVAA